jgi:hypothetical protein
MSTQAQIDANRANSLKSTGPKSAVGKSKSAANSSKHGLQANPTTIFESHPHERSQYDSLKSKLFAQILPDGELELQTFERYVFATFQADRARQMEIDAQSRWLNEPNHDSWFLQMERFIKLASIQERRADRALTELRKLQRDRLSALDVQNELYLLEQNIPIPATLPIAEMRKSDQAKTSPASIAMSLLSTTPEIKSILNGQTKPTPPEPVKISADELLLLQQMSTRR